MIISFDRKTRPASTPATHALVVGVSDYEHLPPREVKEGDPVFGLHKLSSAALTAYRVAAWLLAARDRLAAPLASLRVLIAPSARELESEDAVAEGLPPLADFADHMVECSVEGFVAEANEWREEFRERRQDTSFFYFAGLGKELSAQEPLILLRDFAKLRRPKLSGTVSVNNLLYGLSPSASQQNIARTQLFFVDSSRTRFAESTLSPTERWNTTPVFDADSLAMDDRSAVVIHSSRPGERSFAEVGKQTLFSQALLNCLDAAAVPQQAADGGLAWWVTINSLVAGLRPEIDRLNDYYTQVTGNLVRQEFECGGLIKDGNLVQLTEPPEVEVRLSVQPTTAASRVGLTVRNSEGETVAELDAGKVDGRTIRLPGGYYTLRATVAGGNRAHTQTRQLTPLAADWVISVPA